MDRRPFTNIIPPESFPFLQFIANQVEDAARGLDLVVGDERITARTIAYEILRITIPNSCMHVDFRKYNSHLLTCKGCFGFFKSKNDLAPIQLDLYPQFKRKVQQQNIQGG